MSYRNRPWFSARVNRGFQSGEQGGNLTVDRRSPRAEHFVQVRQTLQSAMERVNKARSERGRSGATTEYRGREDVSPKQE